MAFHNMTRGRPPKSDLMETEDTKLLKLPGILISPVWLSANLSHPNLRLLDVRLRDSYDEVHLPDAVWVDLQALSHTVNGVAGMLLGPDEYAARMGELGVDHEKVVVAYDDNWGMPAARVLWTLARYGHPQVAILNGGWDSWEEAGYPTSNKPFTPPRTTFTPDFADDHAAERKWLLERGDDPNVVIIDTRTPAEYDQGHLPNAICWDWMNGVPLDGWDAVRPAEELRAELTTLGITPDKEIVTYCRSGARASHTYLLLRSLGFPRVRNYDGSWLEWSQHV